MIWSLLVNHSLRWFLMVPPKDVFIQVLIHPKKYFVGKLLGVRSFDSSIGHLTHWQATIFASLGKFNFPFVVWTVTLTFLGCWALIALTLVTCFQQDDRPIFLMQQHMLRLAFPRFRWHYKMSEPCYPKVSIFMSLLLRAWWFSLTPNYSFL